MASSFISLTINSGFQHSDVANVRNGGILTLVANALTSCQLFLQCGTQANSASLKRLDVMGINTGETGAAPVSSNWVWSVGIGNRAIGLPLVGPFLRLETSVVQADNRSLSLIVGGL